MRTLSPAAATAVLVQSTSEVLLCLLEISHPSITTVRLVNNTEAVTTSAGLYKPYPFVPIFPEDSDAGMPSVELIVDNIDREVMRQLREVQSPPKCVLSVILASSPNTVEVGPVECVLRGIEYDASQIRGTLGPEEDFLDQAVPGQIYSPTNSPGIFV